MKIFFCLLGFWICGKDEKFGGKLWKSKNINANEFFFNHLLF